MRISQPTAQVSPATPQTVGLAQAAGTSSEVSAGDHQHGIQLTPIDATLGAQTATGALSNWANILSISITTAGTYFVYAHCIVVAGASADAFEARLTDGVTVFADDATAMPAGSRNMGMSMGFLYVATGPATITLQVADVSSANGLVQANVTGDGKDTQLVAIPISV